MRTVITLFKKQIGAALGVLFAAGASAAFFSPKISFARGETAAKAECVTELYSRRVLYANNLSERLPMASTTKILTAITAIENTSEADLQEERVIPDEAAGIEGSSVYLKRGDLYSSEELLYGLMLRSGNDCAVALAIRTGGSVEKFAAMMNRTAQKAGALDSRFLNPHGLPKEGHYTTARDLSLIACYALKNELFAKIVSAKRYEPRGWENKNKMLKNYDGAIGVKTGYTAEAGRCLVSAATRQKMTLVCAVLNCRDTYGRSAALLDDAFAAYEYAKILDGKTPIVVERNGKKVNAATNKDLYYPLLPEECGLLKKTVKPLPTSTAAYTSTFASEAAKGEKNTKIVGQIEIYLGNQLIFSENLYKI